MMGLKRKNNVCLFAIMILNFIVVFVCFHEQVFAQKHTIVLATDPWEPYYGPNLEQGGYFTAIVTEAFQRTGYDCDVKFMPWKRALEKAKKGEYDGLLGAFYREDRTQYFLYSAPIVQSHIVFFAKKGRSIHYNTLQDLAPYIIGVIRGYQYSEEFDTAQYLQTEVVTHVEQNIKKLMSDRIDLLIGSKEVVLWLLKTKFPEYVDSVEILDPAYTINNLYVSISKHVKNGEHLVNEFNKGLKMIKEDGTFDRIMRNYGF